MSGPRRVLVFDIGKTNAKAALVDVRRLEEVEVLAAPNRPRPGPPYPHADVAALWRFMLEAAGALRARHGVDAVTVTTHGAAAALVTERGELALPILDYEHDGPDALAEAYDAVRPPFAETGSPRLPLGLNLGAQLFWQFRRFPEARRAAAILPYPQYWTYRLSGVPASEPTSLGAHTDLWAPRAGGFSSLVAAEGWAGLMPPLRRASDALGPVAPAVARAAGLAPGTPVHSGLHDSNASLVPHLLAQARPFAVVSTGTWVISSAIGGAEVALDPARDTLMNVNVFAEPVPSARFMGGRERELLLGPEVRPVEAAAAEAAIAADLMLMPAVEARSGPFQGRAHRWLAGAEAAPRAQREAAVVFYLALVTAECLALIGAEGPVFVEGPLAREPQFTAMLAAATGRAVHAAARGSTGTSIGAALLLASGPAEAAQAAAARPGAATLPDPRLRSYAARWRRRLSECA